MFFTKPAVACALIATGFGGILAAGNPPIRIQPEAIPQPAAQPNPDPQMPYFLVCAEACDDCARTCELCAAHCVKMVSEGKKEHVKTLKTCQDCAAICSAAGRVVTKSGPLSDLICTACADACKRCGDACQEFAEGDPIMKQCADQCRACEKACREMLKTVAKPSK